jgi:hypothetical protein
MKSIQMTFKINIEFEGILCFKFTFNEYFNNNVLIERK